MVDRNARFYRMNKIRDILKNRPHRNNELLSIAFGSDLPSAAKRSLQYDLEALTIMKLITLEDGFYHSTEEKQTFRNQAEYRAAVTHTKKLMLSDRYNQNFDQIVVHAIAGVLLSGMHNLVMQHLKTGYYFEIYQPLMQYRQYEEKYPSLSHRKRVLGESYDPVPDNVVSRYNSLEEDIGYKIYTLVSHAENGVPLKGNCISCPTRYVKIG